MIELKIAAGAHKGRMFYPNPAWVASVGPVHGEPKMAVLVMACDDGEGNRRVVVEGRPIEVAMKFPEPGHLAVTTRDPDGRTP